MDHYHPYQLTGIILTSFTPCASNEITSYDQVILSQYLGKSAKDRVIGLETVEFQVNLLGINSISISAYGLYYVVSEYDKEKTAFEELYNIYIKQDIDSLYKLAITENTAANQALLDNRNINWVDTIPDLISASPCLIVVGAGHLGGENGLINLLENEGFILTPVLLNANNMAYKSLSTYTGNTARNIILFNKYLRRISCI
jgi:uncharacterized protein YbaP (TraB family)